MEQVVVFPVLSTALDTSGLIQACRHLNIPNPSRDADSKNLAGLVHTAAVLDVLQSRPTLTSTVMHLGYLFVTWPEQMTFLLSYARGMPYFEVNRNPRYSAVIIASSVDQWITACKHACTTVSDSVVRYTYNRVYRDLEQRLPKEMLGRTSDFGDGTFLLEYK